LNLKNTELKERGKLVTKTKKQQKNTFYAFNRAAFGTINVRTDGNRVMVYTHSGRENMKEAYAFSVNKKGKVNFEHVKKIS